MYIYELFYDFKELNKKWKYIFNNELKCFSFNLSWFFKDFIDSIKLFKFMLVRKYNLGKYLMYLLNWNVCIWNIFKIWSVFFILKEEKIFFFLKCMVF